MANPILSICIPTYNRGDVLKKCIDSIVGNIAFSEEIEIVVSDNCSTDCTKQLMNNYGNRYRNISYYRQDVNIGGERNFIFVLEHAKGDLLKLHNDYSIFTEEGLKALLGYVRENVEQRTLLFFQNKIGESHQSSCDNLDAFVEATRMDTAWIGSYGYWKDDYLPIFPKDEKIATQFMQLDWFLQIFKKKQRCIVCTEDYSRKYSFQSKHGDYNMFKIKVVNFLGMFKPFIESGELSQKTYNNLQKDVYKNLLGWLYRIYIKRDKNYAYSSSGAFSLLFKEFGKFYWFYTEMFLFPLKKFFLNPLKYLSLK